MLKLSQKIWQLSLIDNGINVPKHDSFETKSFPLSPVVSFLSEIALLYNFPALLSNHVVCHLYWI